MLGYRFLRYFFQGDIAYAVVDEALVYTILAATDRVFEDPLADIIELLNLVLSLVSQREECDPNEWKFTRIANLYRQCLIAYPYDKRILMCLVFSFARPVQFALWYQLLEELPLVEADADL
ncbi:MAG: hypothetical protein M1817_002539 [Caeruleum heppii]|nr:MAG: hypothetical protein M1817_002539 [Caeruleum heppii]